MAIPDGWLQSTQFAVLSLKLPVEIRYFPGNFGELGNVTYKDMHKHIGIGQMHLPSACTKYIHALPSAYTSWTFQWKKPRDQQCQKNCNMLTCPAWILSHFVTLLSHSNTFLPHSVSPGHRPGTCCRTDPTIDSMIKGTRIGWTGGSLCQAMVAVPCSLYYSSLRLEEANLVRWRLEREDKWTEPGC